MRPTFAVTVRRSDRFDHGAAAARRAAGRWRTSAPALFGGALVASFLWSVACSNGCNNDHPPPSILPPPTGGQGGSAGGAGGEGGAPVCGDGVKEPYEACEGDDLGGASCLSLGLGAGVVTCTAACTFDISACNSNENCYDGQDNDGDGRRDCEDPDCAAVCADSCASPVPLDLPAFVTGDTAGHASTLDSSCASPSGSGPEVVYQLTAPGDGVVNLTLLSQANLTLSARSACSAGAPELGRCANFIVEPPGAELLTVPVSAQDELFVIVDGDNPAELGVYTLDASFRVPSCGDAHIDPGEQCDDGNTDDGDGCDKQCVVEITEHEPNNDLSHANAYPPPPASWYAMVSDNADIDYVSVVVGSDGSTIEAVTSDLGDVAGCAAFFLDTAVTIRDALDVSKGVDAPADGSCSHVVATPLTAGTYYVRVEWGHAGLPPPLAYALQVAVTP